MIETSIALSVLYLLFTAFCIYNWLHIKKFSAHKTAEEKLSIVVACRNEEKNILPFLNSVMNQVFDKQNFELILVDDSSNDNTKLLAEKFAETNSLNIKVLSLVENKSGKKEAIEYGISTAKHNLLVTTDSDCLLPKSWLATISEFYQENRPKMIVMPVQIIQKDFFSSMQAVEFMSLQATTASFIQGQFPLMCNGANLAFEKKVFEEVNAFEQNRNIATGDDTFLMLAIDKKFPGSIAYLKSDTVVVKTHAQKNLKSFFEQRVRWASKVKHYKKDYISITGWLVTAVNFFMVLFLIAAFFNEGNAAPLLFLFSAKCLADFIFLATANRFFKVKNFVLYFLPVQLLYPFYILAVAFLSIKGRYEWRGRKQ